MKQSFAILLAFLILSIAVKDLSIYVAFKVNQDYIAQSLCVNIEKPQLECHGKCVLSKELQESKEQKDASLIFNPENKQLISYTNTVLFVQNLTPHKEDVQLPLYKGLLINPSLFSIFHPPRKAYFLA